MIDLLEKEKKKKITDEEVMAATTLNKEKLPLVKKDGKGGIVVQGLNDLAVHFAKCCNPIPGDEIVGFVTRGRGVTIHRTDCVNIMNMSDEDRGRLIEAEWLLAEDEKNAALYAAEVVIYAQNRTGLLVDISRTLTERKIDIGQMSVRTNKQGVATLEMSFSVHSKDELSAVIRELRKIQNVVDVTRKTG